MYKYFHLGFEGLRKKSGVGFKAEAQWGFGEAARPIAAFRASPDR
jgi:hypothetical protein